jgi:type I restriction enzyme S subunit
MSEASFPQEWVKCTIGDACALNPKEKLPDNLDVGFMPMAGVPTNHFGTCNFETRPWEKVKKGFTQFKNGDVIFAKITPCFENSKAAIIRDFPSGWGAGSTEYYVLRPYGDLVRPEILFALIKSKEFLVSGAVNMSGSVGHKRVPKDFVSGYELPLPPFAEQKVIADKLDTLLAQVDNTKARLERIPKILKRFRQSVLAAAVSGRLTDEWRRGRPNNPSWVALRLGALIKNGPQNGIYKPLKLYGSGSLIIRIDSFYDGQISCWGKLKRVKIEAAEIEKWQVHQGDLLINRVNSIEYLGKSALVGELSEPAVFESNIMRLSLDRAKAAPEFISLFLRSPAGIAQLRSNAKLAVNQASINQGDVKNCSMELPGLDEQTEIVRRVDQLFVHADHLEQQVNNAMARVGNLTQSILTKAFRGELTEQWRENNPELISGDNSAAALLEMIKSERAAVKPVKKTRSKRTTV